MPKRFSLKLRTLSSFLSTSYSCLFEGQPSSNGNNMEMCVKTRRLQGMSGVNEPYWYDISCDNQYKSHRVYVCSLQLEVLESNKQQLWHNMVCLLILILGILLILCCSLRQFCSNCNKYKRHEESAAGVNKDSGFRNFVWLKNSTLTLIFSLPIHFKH